MATTILASISAWIISVISTLGYGGVVLLMAIQSANIPIPSEVIIPFAGFLVAKGTMNIWLLTLAGAIGSLIGSIFSYYLGVWGGRPLVEKYGKYIFISHHDLDITEKWFTNHGEITVFVGRILPIIRTFISFPAGIAEMNFKKFVIYSFLGSVPWTLSLAYIGLKLGENWENIRKYTHGLDWVVLVLLILGIVWWVGRHIKNRN
jgi:membrane protein DedA with SNARE-associated domain